MLRPWMQDTMHSISAASLALVLGDVERFRGEVGRDTRRALLAQGKCVLSPIALQRHPTREGRRCVSTALCALGTRPTDWRLRASDSSSGLPRPSLPENQDACIWPGCLGHSLRGWSSMHRDTTQQGSRWFLGMPMHRGLLGIWESALWVPG